MDRNSDPIFFHLFDACDFRILKEILKFATLFSHLHCYNKKIFAIKLKNREVEILSFWLQNFRGKTQKLETKLFMPLQGDITEKFSVIPPTDPKDISQIHQIFCQFSNFNF